MKVAAYSLAAIASMVLGTSVDAHSTFDICQGGKNLLGIHHVDTIFKDGALQVTARGTALDTIMGEGSAKLVVKAVGIPLMMETISISDEARRTHNLRAGETFEETIVQAIPFEFPRGLPLDAELVFYDNQNNEASCVEFDFTLDNEENDRTQSGVVSTSPFDYAEYLFKQWFEHFEEEIPIAINDMEEAFSTFKKNLMKIIFHNEGDHTYTMSMNQFGAMTPQQFKDTLMGYRQPDTNEPGVSKQMHEVDASVTLPSEVDWTTKGAVTNVKNQGACGSCWSFATTGALEGAYFLKYGKLVSFSEEQLVTCDHTDLGCGGGIMDYAYQWIERNGGICEESADPYVSGNGRTPSCDKSCKVVPNSAPKSFYDVPHSEDALMSAVAQQPVAIAIEADQLTFQFYSKGVMTGKCGTQLDHGVLLVGYGTEKGVDFWKVKNSWGPSWGDHGYIRFQRGKNQRGGECGILNSASYPSF